MSDLPPCNCTAERIGPSGRAHIVCTCPIPADRPPSLRYGVSQSEWRRISKRVIARDGGVCRYCGSTDRHMQCDHVVPYSRGGTNDDENLVAACADCNRRKKNIPPEKWLA